MPKTVGCSFHAKIVNRYYYSCFRLIKTFFKGPQFHFSGTPLGVPTPRLGKPGVGEDRERERGRKEERIVIYPAISPHPSHGTLLFLGSDRLGAGALFASDPSVSLCHRMWITTCVKEYTYTQWTHTPFVFFSHFRSIMKKIYKTFQPPWPLIWCDKGKENAKPPHRSQAEANERRSHTCC